MNHPLIDISVGLMGVVIGVIIGRLWCGWSRHYWIECVIGLSVAALAAWIGVRFGD